MHRLLSLLTVSLFVVLSVPASQASSCPPSTSQIDLARLLSLSPVLSPDFGSVNLSAPVASSQSESQPDPIAKDYPDQTTGTLNASYFVIPISYAKARSIIPEKYPILIDQIKAIWPGYKNGKYPLVINSQLDHDVQQMGINIPDFHIVAFRFPFVDLLSNGCSPFTYVPSNLLDGVFGIAAEKIYGTDTILANFTPPADPYHLVTGAGVDGPRYASAIPTLKGNGRGFSAVFGDKGELNEEEYDFWKAVLKQPNFGNPAPPTPVTCVIQYKFYDTVVTTGKYAPIYIEGSVDLEAGVVKELPKGLSTRGVEGARFDVAFLEKNFLNCADLK